MKTKLKDKKIQSRKLWVTLITGLLIITNQALGLKLDHESLVCLSGIVVTYLTGQSAVDFKKEGN